MKDFVKFLLSRAYYSERELYPEKSFIDVAAELTFQDMIYHYPSITFEKVVSRIQLNQNELGIFIYRLGNLYFEKDREDPIIYGLNSVNKVFAGCEIYFSNQIDTGFNIIHGLGTVIGSRNKIGKGFMIYQQCTIGHYNDFENGSTIGNDVTLFSGSQIIGEVTIGDFAIIGCNSFVNTNIPEGAICAGSPARVINLEAKSKLKGFRENYR